MALTVTACGVANATPDQTAPAPPTTLVDGVAVLVEPTTVLETEPGPVYCLDGTERWAAVWRITTGVDGEVARDLAQAQDCRPWPTHCQDGTVFIPPTALAGYQSQCLTYGRPLFEWWVLLEFGGEAPRMNRDISRESGWNPNALGPLVCRHGHCDRAIGLAQLLGWQHEAAKLGLDVHLPHDNIVMAHVVRVRQGWSAWSTDRG